MLFECRSTYAPYQFACTLQAHARRSIARQRYLKQQWAALTLEAGWRSRLARLALRRLKVRSYAVQLASNVFTPNPDEMGHVGSDAFIGSLHYNHASPNWQGNQKRHCKSLFCLRICYQNAANSLTLLRLTLCRRAGCSVHAAPCQGASSPPAITSLPCCCHCNPAPVERASPGITV